MTNATTKANAAPMPNRRAALGSFAAAAGAMLAAPKIAKASDCGKLADLIEAHEKTYAAFDTAAVELEATEPPQGAFILGPSGYGWVLYGGREKTIESLEFDFRQMDRVAQAVASVSPDLGAQVAAVLAAERSANLARLDAAFAPHEAAKVKWREANDAEETALTAICRYRCQTMDELGQKFAYLARYRDVISDEQSEAILGAMMPEGGDPGSGSI